jgi:hypothetical protein
MFSTALFLLLCIFIVWRRKSLRDQAKHFQQKWGEFEHESAFADSAGARVHMRVGRTMVAHSG